jgi:secretion/DNA translocation related TadE-like protein
MSRRQIPWGVVGRFGRDGFARRVLRVRAGGRRTRGADRGSAPVWSVGVIAVLCVGFAAVLALGHAVVVRHRAAGGADLAALAAADHWVEGTDGACARADGVARAQGARLVRCAIVGETSDVTAASARGPFTAEARARAGPAGPVPEEGGFTGSAPTGSAPTGSGPAAVRPDAFKQGAPGREPHLPAAPPPSPPAPPAAAP